VPGDDRVRRLIARADRAARSPSTSASPQGGQLDEKPLDSEGIQRAIGAGGVEVAETTNMARLTSSKLLLLGLIACGADQGDGQKPIADLRADSNRDGEVRVDDDSDMEKVAWDAKTGAIFLANIDDDSRRCKSSLNDMTIALCNDGQDDIVNGEDDARDLARLKTRPARQPSDARGRVVIATEKAVGLVRLFKRSGPGPADFEPITDESVLSREELEKGVELGIEARDIVRDEAGWDGYVDIKLIVSSKEAGEATDTVRMRVAPVLTYHHLLAAETVWVSDNQTMGNRRMRRELAAASDIANVPVQTLSVEDQWTQDFFEPAFMTMPGPNGTQQAMRVNYRSPNIFDAAQKDTPLRPAGQIVFTLRGKDVAGVQQFDIGHNSDMDSLSSFGNFETVPPYEKDGITYPFGRVLRGSTASWFPDRAFAKMVDAQRVQPSIEIDTSWLYVGHVDETISFVKAPTKRGWVLMINDAPLAKKMLDDAVAAGEGDAPMFVGKTWIDFETGNENPADTTIAKALADEQVMMSSAEAAVEVDAQLDILRREVGLTDDEIIRVPFLHTTYGGKSVAYQPGTVNGIYLSDTLFASPEPHGPVVGGRDIFKEALSIPLSKIGVTVSWVEDWDAYHRVLGEVHCGSNATRKIPEARWWESGR
jgi:protein-arginine deiminase